MELKILDLHHMFMLLSDTLDFGKRQELLATVNNQFKYYRDKEEERRIMEENIRYRERVIWLVIGLVLITMASVLLHLYRKNRHLAEVMRISNRLKDVTREIETVGEELKQKELLLAEKQEENRRFVTLLHKAELEENAAEVINAIKKASEGRHSMSQEDWRRFYHAVDEVQPQLMERIVHHLGRFTEQQQQVCYLMSIGLTNSQIENLTDIPHVTVWRWVKKFEFLYS